MELLYINKEVPKENINFDYVKDQYNIRFKDVNFISFQKTQSLKQSFPFFSLKYHAYERWNERIGPKTTYSFLKNRLFRIFNEPDRIILLNESFGLIDNDILFTYFCRKRKFEITTFYGRLSICPYLLNLQEIKKWRNHTKDNLPISLKNVQSIYQKMPLISNSCIYFKKDGCFFKMDNFLLDEQSSFFITYFNSSKTIFYKTYHNHQNLPKYVSEAILLASSKQKLII
jgi:hypothetical protein